MGFSDRKISNYFNYNGIKTNRGKKFSCGLVWMLRKKYYKSKLREQNNPVGKIKDKIVIEEWKNYLEKHPLVWNRIVLGFIHHDVSFLFFLEP